MNSRLLIADKKNLLKAAENLLNGNLVAFPTETVYGLGASATNQNAINRIYEVKGRPKDHPLIVHVSSTTKLDMWAKEIPRYAWELASAFWPGPMTLILKRSKIAKDFVTGGQDTIGIRIPKNDIALTLLKEFEELGGMGIAAPSANRFGAVSPTTANHVIKDIDYALQDSDLILDGGECEIGVESTIVDCTSELPRILRPGAVLLEEVNLISNPKFLEWNHENYIKFPGVFEMHYSPRAKVNLNTTPTDGDGFIAMSEIETPDGAIRLSAPENVTEFAAQLYAALHFGDELKLPRIVVITPPEMGLGVAINDRLRKASNKQI
jgi:L-threonylcarbamoyladenylate synthase